MEKTSKVVFSRYYLFTYASDHIQDSPLRVYFNVEGLANMYRNSAKLIKHMEENTYIDKSYEDFMSLFEENFRSIEDENLKHQIDVIFNYDIDKSDGRKVFLRLFSKLLKCITDYQNKYINSTFYPSAEEKMQFNVGNLPQTFLSYAYSDKGITYALFLYFYLHGGFLYVNWMWSPSSNNIQEVKKELNEALGKSSQFLFLQTPNSEFALQGNHNIRQWCSWEIGNYYTKKRIQNTI